ncbi:MAG: hypothetical protein IH611_09315 [Deltaproteobacteria bacterium]|nr:hypothetical protein [Deltaproteobacteria bacterium]
MGTLLFAACGGGGGGSTSTGTTGGTTAGTVTVQGSVPGTVFVAVDDGANAEAARATATGTPKTFSMVLSTGKRYRFYVMENEGTGNSRIYPMYIGASNVFGLDSSADGQTISLGMISPDLATGRSIPATTPALMTGHGTSGAVPASLSGNAFSMDNVLGTSWAYNTIMTSGTMAWEHGTVSIDNAAFGHMTEIFRNGISRADRNDIPYRMTLSGMLLDSADNTFQCVVSRDGDTMVATFSDSLGGPALMIGQKRGGSYATDGSDMTGTWRFQRFTAGSDNTTSGWAYGTMQFTFGNASIVSMTTNAGAGSVANFSFAMDANGVLTESGDASFHGVMSASKNMIVATDTDGGDPEMWILMKDTGGTYSTADMAGDWVMHSVAAGNAGSRGWTYGHSAVDGSGNDTFSGMMGDAGPVPSTELTFQMNGGVMTMDGTGGGMMGGGTMGGGMMGGGLVTSTFHGTMNADRDIMVSSYSDGTGAYPFSVQVK